MGCEVHVGLGCSCRKLRARRLFLIRTRNGRFCMHDQPPVCVSTLRLSQFWRHRSRARTSERSMKCAEEQRATYAFAAAHGNAEAQYSLGAMHARGEGGPVDYSEARRLFSLAAEKGLAIAQYSLGAMHARGEGGPVDNVEAQRLFGLAGFEDEATPSGVGGQRACEGRDGGS